MPIDQLIDIDWFSFLMRFIFSQHFQKHGLFMHFNDENCDKTLIIVENMGIRFYNNINSQLISIIDEQFSIGHQIDEL